MNRLIHFHLKHGAELEEIGGIEIPIRYGSRFNQEIQTMLKGTGIYDVSSMLNIQVKGPDAEPFLQGMMSNDVSALKIGGFQPHFICASRGKIEHRIEMIRYDEETYWLCCAHGEGMDVGRKLDQFHIIEDL